MSLGRGFWSGEGGGREVLKISYPLILSQMSFTVQTFIDRLFLTWFSPEAMAGAVTALFVTFALFAVSGGLSAASLIAFVNDVMGGTALTLGWMAMAQGIGSLLGAALIERVSTIIQPAYLVGVPLLIADGRHADFRRIRGVSVANLAPRYDTE